VKQREKLSNLPSEMIRQSIADVILIEKDPKYTIYMDDWHIPPDESINGLCEVCQAGA